MINVRFPDAFLAAADDKQIIDEVKEKKEKEKKGESRGSTEKRQ